MKLPLPLERGEKARRKYLRSVSKKLGTGRRGRPYAFDINRQSGIWNLIVALRLRQYAEAGRGPLSRLLDGRRRMLWNLWTEFRRNPLLMAAKKPAPFSPKVESWLEEIGLPYPPRIFTAGRLRQYHDAGCLRRMLCGHPHEAMLRRLWVAYRADPLLATVGRPPFPPKIEAWLAAVGLPHPRKK